MITLILIKTPKCSRTIDYLIDTNKLKDKKLSNLIEKSPKVLSLSSTNYWSQDNLFKNPVLRNMTWFEERLYWSLDYSSVSLPTLIDKIINVNFEN